MGISQTQTPQPVGLTLLFAAGKRPTRAALRDFAATQQAVSLTHDPSEESPIQVVSGDKTAVQAAGSVSSEIAGEVWVELLREGLTFDLHGLAPGSPCDFPDVDHRFDLDQQPGAFRMEALRLSPGQHLAGGERTMPVVKGMVALARDIVHHFDDLAAVVWQPSRSAIGRRYFESVTTAWLEGGAFPALGLTAFKETIDGALQTIGLDFWIDQELRIEPPLSADKITATRLGVRIINQLVIVGGLSESERIVAPDGTRLVMRPSRNGKFIRVWRE